jgi:tetratricopeptide (TPR) repeat protein
MISNTFHFIAILAGLLAAGAAVAQAGAAAQADAVAPSAETDLVPQSQLSPEELGDLMMAHRRYQAAIEAYKKGPRNSAKNWNKLGIAYQQMFNLDDAMRCYQASLKLEPKNPQVLNNLGTVYDMKKNFGGAERMYRKALKINPESALIWKNLGTTLLEQRKYKKGKEAYRTAQNLDPAIFDKSSLGFTVQNTAAAQDRGAMNYYMAESCVKAGKSKEAIEFLRLSLNQGFASVKMILNNKEFTALLGLPEFEKLLADQKTP